jgi:hypothetical protein
MNREKFNNSTLKDKIKGFSLHCDSLRKNVDNPLDITFESYVKKKAGVASLTALFDELGINPSVDTIENIFTLPDESVRWLVPEIFREALRLGMRKAPIWSDIVAAEQTVKQLTITSPWFNMSEATPAYVAQGETIPLGNVSFDKKQVSLRKIGKGVKIPYEVRNYVSINIVSIFLQDFGVKLGQAIDTLLINTLINGEQTNGSESAPVIGVASAGTLTYSDLLTIWVRMSRIGKTPTKIIGGEAAALVTLNLAEFKTNTNGGTAGAGIPGNSPALKLKTPIPSSSDYYIHGAMPANQQLIIDPTAAVIKYNAQPLLVESEKIVSNQTEATYATLTTGFGIVFRDARVLLDKSIAFSGNGFPTYMDADTAEVVNIQ